MLYAWSQVLTISTHSSCSESQAVYLRVSQATFRVQCVYSSQLCSLHVYEQLHETNVLSCGYSWTHQATYSVYPRVGSFTPSLDTKYCWVHNCTLSHIVQTQYSIVFYTTSSGSAFSITCTIAQPLVIFTEEDVLRNVQEFSWWILLVGLFHANPDWIGLEGPVHLHSQGWKRWMRSLC